MSHLKYDVENMMLNKTAYFSIFLNFGTLFLSSWPLPGAKQPLHICCLMLVGMG